MLGMNTAEPFGSQYWRDLGLEKQNLASRMKHPLAKAPMIRLSNHYEGLAKKAEGSIDKLPELLRLHPSFLHGSSGLPGSPSPGSTRSAVSKVCEIVQRVGVTTVNRPA